ncbi:MAG: HDOD domain-containing protein, partial [Planctomycetota bacterium]
HMQHAPAGSRIRFDDDAATLRRNTIRVLTTDGTTRRRFVAWCRTSVMGGENTNEGIEHALALLDPYHAAALVFLAALRARFEPDVQIQRYSTKRLWRHSTAVGLMAQLIYRSCGGRDEYQGLLAGSLHHIGLLQRQTVDPDRFHRLVNETDEVTARHGVEIRLWGQPSGRITETILKAWKMPLAIVTAASAMDPHSAGSDPQTLRLTAAVQLADYLVCRSGWTPLGTRNAESQLGFRVFEILQVDHQLMSMFYTRLFEILAAANEF